jgi:DNA-binding ferritin-like protein
MSTAADLIARCFAARTAAHIAHLRTKSFAAHKALEDFYEGIVDRTDTFAEAYQGVFGVIESYPDCEICKGELKPIKELREWLVQNRTKVAQGQRELENLIDEISALCDSTIYKLVNLK